MLWKFVVPAPDLSPPGEGKTGVAPETSFAVDFLAGPFLAGERVFSFFPIELTPALAALAGFDFAPPTTLAFPVGACVLRALAPFSYLRIEVIATVAVFPSLKLKPEKLAPDANETTLAPGPAFLLISGRLSPFTPLLTAAETHP